MWVGNKRGIISEAMTQKPMHLLIKAALTVSYLSSVEPMHLAPIASRLVLQRQDQTSKQKSDEVANLKLDKSQSRVPNHYLAKAN